MAIDIMWTDEYDPDVSTEMAYNLKKPMSVLFTTGKNGVYHAGPQLM